MFNIFDIREKTTNFINKIITDNANKVLSQTDFFQREIYDWKQSEVLKEQITGQRYYDGEQDIKNAKRTAIGEGGRLITIDNLPNNKIIDNQYAKAVDQKVNYILGNPLVINTENEQYAEQLNYILDKHFLRTLKNVCKDSLNCGIGWLYVYYDEKGELCFKRFKPYEILPFWKTEEHNELDYVVRVYPVIVYDGNTKKVVEKVEVYSTSGIQRYVYEGGRLIDDNDNPSTSYIQYTDGENVKPLNWSKIPIIPFKYNSEEIPLIRRCKEIQDCINSMMSDFANRMQEDNRNSILILKNYDGEDLGQFRQNLATYGAVKVKSIEGASGDVTALNIEVNADNYKSILNELKKALVENAKGFDCKDDRLNGNPNQMNIQSMYSDIDIDSNGMEVEYQAAFDRLLWFVDMHLNNTGVGNFENEDVTITFNRSVLMNEGETITNIKNSVGLVSNETLLAQHPYVDNVDRELERLAAEKEESLNQYSQPMNNEHTEDKATNADLKNAQSGAEKIELLNGAQITALTNIIQRYNEGTLSRNAAITMAVSTLGVSRENAEAMIEEKIKR